MALIDAGAGPLDGRADVPAVDALRTSPARLAAVQRSGLLDSEAEEAFDAATRLAALLLKVPASFVSIVDAERDFYKSQFGFSGALAAERQLAGRTFCHYTLDGAEPLVIADTHAEPQWRAVPTVTTLGVRAYVGVPLQIDGQNVGSFCVIDSQPREWSAGELDILRQLSLSVTRELGLRDALRRAADEAARTREMAVAREQTLAAVVHDLRSPLQVLALSAVQLQRTGSEAQAPLAQRMLRAARSLQSLVDGLVFNGGVAPPAQVRPERVAAAVLLGDAVETMGVIAARAGIELVLGAVPDADVRVDHAQMLRVFSNLVGNCTKYCPSGSRVVLSGRCEGDEVLLGVSDEGPGLSDDERERAFDTGWQGAEGRARGDGSGLGLAIVRSLVALNGGRATLASSPGRGTTVTVHLPRCA